MNEIVSFYTEHYKVSARRWQDFESKQLAAILERDSKMLGYSHAIMADGSVSVAIQWRLI